PVLVDEDEDPKEDEFEEEEDPQKEEDDMEVDIKEDENELELTYLYKEMDPLNPPPPASESEPDYEVKVKDAVKSEDETVPASVYEVGESSTAAIPRQMVIVYYLVSRDGTLTLFLVGLLIFRDDCVVARRRMHWSRRRAKQKTSFMVS
ncbi:hypothetical protein Tco_0402954, partial [Tanacetum coccineum]